MTAKLNGFGPFVYRDMKIGKKARIGATIIPSKVMFSLATPCLTNFNRIILSVAIPILIVKRINIKNFIGGTQTIVQTSLYESIIDRFLVTLLVVGVGGGVFIGCES
jgi:hypothetical protein